MGKFAATWQDAVLPPSASISEAIESLNIHGLKIILCVDSTNRLLGTVTDGDVRRAMLQGVALSDHIGRITNKTPLVVSEGSDAEQVRLLMRVNRIQQIPVVNFNNMVVGLHQWDDINDSTTHEHTMIIMAGGRGRRLQPLTEECPKPMLPLGGKPMLEHILERSREQGFRKFIFSINYLGHLIKDYFGDGGNFGVAIEYLTENSPLGTAGALSLITDAPDDAFVVTNGDVVTDIDYSKVLEYGRSHDAAGVMAVKAYDWTNPFGVVEMDGINITGFKEKPTQRSYVNAGVYALTPQVLEYLTPNVRCDMPELFLRIRNAGLSSIAYAMHEPWLDVGRPEDLAVADEAATKFLEQSKGN